MRRIARQDQCAGTDLGERPGAGDIAGVRPDRAGIGVDRPCTRKGDVAIGREGRRGIKRAVIEGDPATGSAQVGVARDLNRAAAVDRRAAGIGVGAGEDQRARAHLADRAGAADDAGIGDDVAVVEGKRPVIDNGAGDAARGPAIAELKRSRADRCAAGIAAVAGQDRGAGADLLDRAGLGDDAAIGQRVGAVEAEQPEIVDRGACDRSGRPAIAEDQGTAQAAAGKLFRQESNYFVADGSERVVDLIIAPVRDETGQLLFLAPTGTDITESKRAEEKLRQAAVFDEAVMGNMGEGLYTVDSEGKVTSMNPASEKMFGWTLDELRGRRMHDVTHYQHPDGTPFPVEECAGFQVLQHGQNLVGHEDVFIRKDGTFFDVIYSSSPLWENGKIDGLVVVFSDNTTRKQAEKRLVLLTEISELIRKVDDPNELLFAVSKAVGEHLQVRRCLFNEIDVENDLEIVHQDYCRGAESVAGRHKISDYSSITSAEMIAGKTVVNHDSKTDARTAPDYERSYAVHRERAYVAVPLMRENRWAASLWVSTDTPHTWSQEEVSLLETIAERTWIVVEKLRIDAALRASESLYRTIARSIPGGGVYVVDKDMRYLVADGSVTEAFGLSPELLEGRTVSEIFRDEQRTRLIEHLQRNFAGETLNYETEHNGRVYWTQQAPLLDSIGQAIIVTLDITERKQAEESLRQSEERFGQFMQHLPGLAWIKDINGRYVYVNDAAEQVFRTPRQELYGKTDEDIFPPEIAAQFKQNDQRALMDGKGIQVIETLEQEDHILHYSLVSKFPIPGPDGNTTTLIGGTAFDITERRQAEEALRRNEKMFSTLVDSAPFGVYFIDSEFRLRAVNKGSESVFRGIYPLIGRDFAEILRIIWPEPFATEALERFHHTLRTGEFFISPPIIEQRANIEEIQAYDWQIHRITLSDGKFGVVCYFYDLSEQKRMEAAVRASEERYRNLFDLVPVAVYTCDGNGLIQEYNQRAVELWGREPQKNDPKEKYCGSYRMYYPDGRWMPHAECPMSWILAGETLQPQEFEMLVERPDGVRRNVIANPFLLRNERGEIVEAINCLYDITERKQAEEALREAEERFRAILSQATAGIVRKDAEGRLIFVNQAFCSMLGYAESELLGKTVWELTHEEDVAENKRLFDRLLKEGTAFKLEKRLIRRDGSTLWVDVGVAPILDAAGKPQSAVAAEVDITGRKLAEASLQQLNLQLESRVERRTAELQTANQALQESRGRLQILSQRLVEVQEEERRALARELHDRVGQTLAALNINLIIISGQLSADSNQQISTRLNDSMKLVTETIALVRDVMTDLRPAVLDDYGLEAALEAHLSAFRSRYAMEVILEKADRPIPRLGPSVEMTFLRIAEEALMNIVRHAQAKQVRLSLRQEGNAVCLTVQDNGIGFESGQGTKRPGSHGLTIMRERAETFDGTLSVKSVPGQGTRVEVSIPLKG